MQQATQGIFPIFAVSAFAKLQHPQCRCGVNGTAAYPALGPQAYCVALDCVFKRRLLASCVIEHLRDTKLAFWLDGSVDRYRGLGFGA